MSWHIAKINPLTHEVTMKHESGVTFDTVIPDEHRATPESKNKYLHQTAQRQASRFYNILLKILSFFKGGK
jgi:hypothetical protein